MSAVPRLTVGRNLKGLDGRGGGKPNAPICSERVCDCLRVRCVCMGNAAGDRVTRGGGQPSALNTVRRRGRRPIGFHGTIKEPSVSRRRNTHGAGAEPRALTQTVSTREDTLQPLMDGL